MNRYQIWNSIVVRGTTKAHVPAKTNHTALIYMQSRTCAKTFGICSSQSDSSTSPSTPPQHMQTPESCANLPITTAPPASMVIHYDGFILAIFSICPLAFFFTPPTDGGNFFRIFFFHPYLFMAALDLRTERSLSRRKKKGQHLVEFQYTKSISNFFSAPMTVWLQ